MCAQLSCRDPVRGSWLLDYQECLDTTELTSLLSEISYRGFHLEQVIPKLDGTFVVLFRRHDLG